MKPSIALAVIAVTIVITAGLFTTYSVGIVIAVGLITLFAVAKRYLVAAIDWITGRKPVEE